MGRRKQAMIEESTSHSSGIPSIGRIGQHRYVADVQMVEMKQERALMMGPKRKRRRRFHKEFPIAVSVKHNKRVRTEEQGKNRVVDTLLSLQQLKESDIGIGNMGEHLSERHRRGPKRLYTGKNITSFSELEALKNYIQGLGGVFEDGWHIDVQRSLHTGKLSKSFVSPHNERFRSRIEVARHMGLNPTRTGTAHLLSRNTVKFESQDRKTANDFSLHIRNLEGHKDQLYDGGGCLPLREECKKGDNTTKAKNHTAHVNVRAVVAAPSAALVTQRCEETLRSIILTDQFAALNKMLSPSSSSGRLEDGLQLNSPVLGAGSLDMQLIHLRLSTGAYGRSPQLFYGDIQQVWTNIISAGNELIKLSQSLSDLSNNLYKQQIMSLFQAAPGEPSRQDQKQTENHADSSDLHLDLKSVHQDRMLFDNSQISQERHLSHPSSPKPNARLCEAVEAISAVISSPRPANVVGSAKSLTCPTSASSPELKVYVKKLNAKSRKSEDKNLSYSRDRSSRTLALICKHCALERSEDWIMCKKCNAGFHVHCIDSSLNDILPDGQWCCPECAMKNISLVEQSSEPGCGEEVVLKESRREPDVLDNEAMNKKLSGKEHADGPCKKMDENILQSYKSGTVCHMGSLKLSIASIPMEITNCSVNNDRIANDSVSPLAEKVIKHTLFHEASIGRIMKKTLLRHGNDGSTNQGINHASIDYLNHESPEDGLLHASFEHLNHRYSEHGVDHASIEHHSHGSQEHGMEHVSIERLMECGMDTDDGEHQSPDPSVESGSPDRAFLIEDENDSDNANENACTICGVENKKSCVSCAGCPRRYHLSCLQPSLKRLPRKAWFCPSCLCRACKIDADDDQILLCDGCDEGYHTYCLDPPLAEIPEGAWFCPTCARSRNIAPSSPSKVEMLKRKRKSTEPRRSI